MQSRSIHFQQSLLCRPVVGELRSSRILEDPILKGNQSLQSILWDSTLTIEASMRAWQSVPIAVIPMDVESAKAIHTLELAEAVEGHFACTCNKL